MFRPDRSSGVVVRPDKAVTKVVEFCLGQPEAVTRIVELCSGQTEAMK